MSSGRPSTRRRIDLVERRRSPFHCAPYWAYRPVSVVRRRRLSSAPLDCARSGAGTSAVPASAEKKLQTMQHGNGFPDRATMIAREQWRCKAGSLGFRQGVGEMLRLSPLREAAGSRLTRPAQGRANPLTSSSSAAGDTGSRPRSTLPRSMASPTSPSWRRAGSAAATSAATPPSSAPTTCSPATSLSTNGR